MTTETTGFDFAPAYKAYGYGGIAWRVDGYATEWTEEEWVFLGEPEGYDWDTYYQETGYCDPTDDPANYAYNEPEQIEDRTRVEAHMIGDDRTFTFDVEDMTPIPDDDYCSECGQIGCGWGH